MKSHVFSIQLLISLMGMLLISACRIPSASASKQEKIRARDAVLSPGNVVEFKNPNGSGRIVYVSDFVRRYEIEGASYEVTLVQRDKESLCRTGIYNPGESWGPLSMRNAPRFVVDESVLHFPSMEEAVKFFKLGHREYKWVCNDSGLALAYVETPGRYQINVDLFKCYLNGKLMTSIPKQFRNPGFVRLR